MAIFYSMSSNPVCSSSAAILNPAPCIATNVEVGAVWNIAPLYFLVTQIPQSARKCSDFSSRCISKPKHWEFFTGTMRLLFFPTILVYGITNKVHMY